MYRVKAAAALLLLGVGGVLVVGRYLGAVRASTLAEEQAACAALQGQPFRAQAPDFKLPDLQGRQRSLAELRGKVVLLNFWFTGCPPCIEEIPSLLELSQRLDPLRFELLTVSVDESAEEVKAFLKKRGLDERALPILLDREKKVSASYGTSKYPETFLIDRQGVVRQKFIFKRSWLRRQRLPVSAACSADPLSLPRSSARASQTKETHQRGRRSCRGGQERSERKLQPQLPAKDHSAERSAGERRCQEELEQQQHPGEATPRGPQRQGAQRQHGQAEGHYAQGVWIPASSPSPSTYHQGQKQPSTAARSVHSARRSGLGMRA